MLTYQHQCRFVILVLCSLISGIFCVQIQPNFEVIPIWTTDRKFITCSRDRKEFEGRVQWFAPSGDPVGVSPLSTVYQVEGVGSSKLFFVQPYKVNQGFYECRHTKNDTLVTFDKIEMKIYNAIDMSG